MLLLSGSRVWVLVRMVWESFDSSILNLLSFEIQNFHRLWLSLRKCAMYCCSIFDRDVAYVNLALKIGRASPSDCDQVHEKNLNITVVLQVSSFLRPEAFNGGWISDLHHDLTLFLNK